MKKINLLKAATIMTCSLVFLAASITNAGAVSDLGNPKCSMCHNTSVVGKVNMPRALVLEDSDTTKNLKNSSNTLASLLIKSTEAPKLDGKADDVWKKAKELKVITKQLVKTGFNPNVSIKSLHTDKKIYILTTWKDDTADVTKNTWTYDGTNWTRTGSEDRLAFQWDNDIPGFSKVGCAITCHGYGKKKVTPVGKYLDMWHWKSTSNLPYNFLDDGQVTETGRKTDEGSSTPMITKNESKDSGGVVIGPKFMPRTIKSVVELPFAANSILFASNAKLIDPLDKFITGDTLPGYIVNDVTDSILGITAGPTLSFDDVKASAYYLNGSWTVEIERDLNTGNSDDIAFDRSKVKAFGLAVFNRNEHEEHAVNNGPLYLEFVKPQIEQKVSKAVMLVNNVKVYRSAAANSKVLTSLKKGQEVVIIKTTGKWLQVKTTKGTGFIYNNSRSVRIKK